VDGKKEKRGGISSHGKHAGERSWGMGREKAFENGAGGVDEQWREHEVTLSEYGLIVFASN
jgi:hypothetical protein